MDHPNPNKEMVESAFHPTPQTSTTFPHSPTVIDPPGVHISQHDYNFSTRTYDESSATEEHNEYTDEETARLNAETTSSRSSISSLPTSVAPSAIVPHSDAITAMKSPESHELRGGSLSNEASGRKWRDSPFRNPSSVRSIQMRDEDDVIPHHGQRGSRTLRNTSTFSARSSPSISQTKRRGARGSLMSPANAKLKREFPLVLLHCSILSPVMPTKAKISDAALLQAVLPNEYWERWELLTDKVANDVEIQSRGVLIPHPKADYELLEERLLESLELVRPRLRSGHYYGNENVDDVGESESDAETAKQGTKCQDCGRRVVHDIAQDRKWEVKVYAANGLMRAGAWSAAWNEMEKVDVEVSVFLPEAVKREVEERCLHLGIDHDIEQDEAQAYEHIEAECRSREIYGTPIHSLEEEVDGFFESSPPNNNVRRESLAPQHQHQHDVSVPSIELQQLLINYIKVLGQDKRNVVIAALSLAVLFFSVIGSISSQQAIDINTIPVKVSAPSAEAFPHCALGPMQSVSHVPYVPPAGSISVQCDAVTSAEREDSSKTAAPVPVLSHTPSQIKIPDVVT